MAFGIPMMLDAFVLDHLLDNGNSMPQGCRAACAPRKSTAPRPHPARSFLPPHELKELDDSYVLFLDLPGFSREEVTVKVDDGFLIVATATKPAAVDGAQPLQVLLAERLRRAAVNRRWKLPEDALLDGVHASLRNGELVVLIPKRTQQVPQRFVVPILGSDDDVPAAGQAQIAAAPAEPVPAIPETPAAEPPAAPAEAAAAHDAPMADVKDSDGSWEDVSEEEKEAEEAVIKLKGKMPMEGPVLEEIQRQEAERLAQQLRTEDSRLTAPIEGSS